MASSEEEPQDDGDEESFMAEVRARLEAVAKRKRYKRLTVEILASIPDDALEQAILDFIWDRAKAKRGDMAKTLASLPVGFGPIYATWIVEAEVGNGGFEQYFLNSSGSEAQDAVAGYDRIGVHGAARLMERAIAVRSGDDGNPLSELESELQALGEEPQQARLRFIRQHPELFVAK